MAALEAVYYTPDGCIDMPYMLVYNASSLTDGTTPSPLVKSVPFINADFILRAILGVPTCIDTAANGGGFLYYNMSGSQAVSSAYSPFANQYPVVPEKLYPRAGGVVKFQLSKVLRAFTACTVNAVSLPIYYSQVVFQGVNRFYPGSENYRPGVPATPAPYDPDDYILRPFTYNFTLNLNWFAYTAAGLTSIPQTFNVEIQDYDFELHQISVVNATTGVVPTTELLQMTLYDATGKRPMMSDPVNLSIFNAGRTAYSPVFPVPPMIYPVWTNMKFDITSLVCNTDGNSPYSLQFSFVGVQRIPKLKSSASSPTQVVLVGQGA
jgi:hypothetical protein